MAKIFFRDTSDFISLAPNRGGCFASDRITVDGRKVGYMYREKPDDQIWDNGWRFFAGDESDDYVNDPSNLGIYDVNTIANYDPEITQYLDAPFGSAFERRPNGFVAVEFEHSDSKDF